MKILNKEEKATNNVASMVMHILVDNDVYKDSKYINVSVNYTIAEGAPVASMVMHSSHKRGPSRHLGSIPGWSASAPFIISLEVSKY